LYRDYMEEGRVWGKAYRIVTGFKSISTYTVQKSLVLIYHSYELLDLIYTAYRMEITKIKIKKDFL
jgi:hypothetical protein